MDLGGNDRIALERPVASGRNRYLGDAGGTAHPTSVERGLLERLVAGDRRDRQELDGRRGGGQQDRHGVVVAGVAVEDDPSGTRHHPLM